MRPQIPVPSKGLQLKATWGAQVANRVNELCAMAPAGVLHREGFGGIGDQALPKNMRDRRAAGAGQPMPFDLKGEVQTNQDGQKRLVVKWYYGGSPASPIAASVSWNYWPITPPTLNAPTIDGQGWVAVYTGEWAAASNFTDSATPELWYTLQVMPEWQGGAPTFSVGGSWYVQDSSEHDLSDLELDPTAVAQTVVSYVVLGTVTANAGGARVHQAFHGDLHLNDLLCIGEGGGGGGSGDGTDGTTYPMPFQYTRTGTITNCRFYWDGEYQTLADFTPPATCTVWLIATKSGSGAGSWSFQLSTSQGTAANGQQSVKLYDFSGSRIAMDYRTTTLMFGPGPRDYIKAEKADGSISAVLDATGTSAKMSLAGVSHNVTLDAAAATWGDVQLRECDYYPGNAANPTKVNILSSQALTLGAPNVEAVTGMSFAIANGKLTATLNLKNLRTGQTSTATADVCNVHDLDVMVDTAYDALSSHAFTQDKRSVTVIGPAPSGSPATTTVFTTTPLSSE